MIHFLIDGNNLIGKDAGLKKLQTKEKQTSREQLVLLLESYFRAKKNLVSLFLDGFPGTAIHSDKIKIHYSETKTADDLIKHFIDSHKNRKNISVVSSDHAIMNYAKTCSCNVISSEDFLHLLSSTRKSSSEETIYNKLQSENRDFIKLFS